MKALSEIFLQHKKLSAVLGRQEKKKNHDFKFIWSLHTGGQCDNVCNFIYLEADLTSWKQKTWGTWKALPLKVFDTQTDLAMRALLA